jgi:hypothetical protein
MRVLLRMQTDEKKGERERERDRDREKDGRRSELIESPSTKIAEASHARSRAFRCR